MSGIPTAMGISQYMNRNIFANWAGQVLVICPSGCFVARATSISPLRVKRRNPFRLRKDGLLRRFAPRNGG
jgi:hypothetical protein